MPNKEKLEEGQSTVVQMYVKTLILELKIYFGGKFVILVSGLNCHDNDTTTAGKVTVPKAVLNVEVRFECLTRRLSSSSAL